ncbi:MAG: DMT family transporter [Candidatus Dependentiae bacterium]|nr:DMT family transporter [Candidatus Dependentiae bacterium]
MIDIILGFGIFASAITINKLILTTLPPFFFVGVRMLASGLIMLVFHAFRSPRMKMCHLKPDIKSLIIIGILTTFIPSALKAFGLKYLISSKATLISSLDPFVTAIYAYFLWGERVNLRQIFGMCLAFSGIFLLLTRTSSVEQMIGGIGFLSWPEFATIASMLIGRYGWILAQRVLHAERYSPSELNAIIMTVGGSCSLILSALLENPAQCCFPTNIGFWAVFTYSVTIGNIGGYTIYSTLLKKHPITLISLCGISVPLYVHLYGPFILGEPLSAIFFVSFILVAAGTFIFIRNKNKKSHLLA